MTTDLRLLYVDDDPDIRTIVQLALGLDPAIETRTAASGADAIASLADPAWRPDVIVLDVMMPGLSGPDTLEALRDHPVFGEIPVIFMTAKGREADLEAYQAMGAIGVILKPFDPLLLAEHVRAFVAP